jgi:hypothetical protein
MSPEQARGLTVDKRTDIWAFGCVLYELLAGKAPFLHQTMSDTIAAVLEHEPQWTALLPPTPLRIRRLLQRCLEKDPKRRLRDIGDARLEIVSEDPQPVSAITASTPEAVRRQTWAAQLFARADIARALPVAVSLTAVFVVVLVAVMQYREGKQREDLRQTAEQIFYDLRSLEGNLARLRPHDPLSGDLREATYRRDRLTQAYDGYVERLGLYDGKSQTERAVLRMARRLGEVDLDVPADFYKLTMAHVHKWSSTSRLQNAITRARERNLIQRIKKALDERGLPKELIFLALEESEFDTSRVGPRKRAGSPKGLWQITPDLAHRYGLILGPLSNEPQFDSSDERHNEDRSTEAATNYLADLYSSKAAASGLLVIASYSVGDAVREKLEDLPNDPRDRNFWNFYKNNWLPRETQEYVMSVFSAALICEQPDVFDVSLERIW